METIGAADLNTRLDELLDRTVHGETFEIAKNGRLVGRLVPPKVTHTRQEIEDAVDRLLGMAGMGGPMTAEELKATIHEGHRY